MSKIYVDEIAGIASANTVAIPGHVIQVVSTTKTDTFSLSGTTTFTDINGLSASITPSSASSKILVFGNVYVSNSNASGHVAAIRLVRDSTPIGNGTPDGNKQGAIGQSFSTGSADYENLGFTYLDSPSSTSETTYKVQMISRTGNTGYVNRTGANEDDAEAYSVRTSSTITLMEIAG